MVKLKDQAKLKSVSDQFTEETLKNILCTMHNGQKAEVLSWEFDEASTKGDSYLSTVNRIKVTGNVDGKEAQVNLVVKSLPQNIGRRNTYRSAEFFHNEIMFYTKVIPVFEKFLKDKGQSQILCVPRHVASVVDGKHDYIALEDVSPLGYGRISRENCIDTNQCAMILKAMARFHAISFAYKDQNKEEFIEIMDTLHETYFSDNHWNWYKRFHQRLVNIAKNALALEYPGSEAEKRYSSYKFGELFQKAVELCNRKYAPTSIITQGDSWAPNFLAREINGKDEVLILDFQLARCSSPVLDLSFCIYSCTNKALWDQKFDKMLKLYHNELTSTISLLGSDPEKIYSWNIFMKEVKEQFMFGVIFGMEAIPFSIMDESEVFDLDAIIKDDNAVNIDDVWTVPNIKSKSGRQRLANVIVHAVENGFL